MFTLGDHLNLPHFKTVETNLWWLEKNFQICKIV